MKVIPFAVTQINWTDLLRLGTDVMGRSPSRSLDDNRIKTGDLFSVIAALKELEEEGSDPRQAVSQASFQLHHLSCSFMVEVSDEETTALRNMEGLTITFFDGIKQRGKELKGLMLITGTFAQWQLVLPQMLRTDRNFYQKQLFYEIYLWFKRLNLKELFARFSEVSHKDGTFTLES